MSTNEREESGRPSSQSDLSRRDFFKILLAAGAASAAVAAASGLRYFSFLPGPTTTTGSAIAAPSWPKVKITNIASLQPLKPVTFNYPLVGSANILVKLGANAVNGVGPDKDIVAYNTVCQHLGYIVGFYAPGQRPACGGPTATVPEGYCCAHGGQYDFTNGAKPTGPPPRPVPPVVLQYDDATGDIYAVGMGPPTIKDHGADGATDPATVLKYDLAGGEVVTQDTVFKGLQ